MAASSGVEEKWTEARIARAVAFGLPPGKSVLVIPNCGWTGHECDLLVVEKGLRIIDVEIKVSRSDFKADASKAKWWHHRPWSRRHKQASSAPRLWPVKVWKHYYILPADIWKPEMLDQVSPASGVLLVKANKNMKAGISFLTVRRAKPNRQATPISPADAIDLARLASLRMWTALVKD